MVVLSKDSAMTFANLRIMTTKKNRQQTEEDVNDIINYMTDTELLHRKRISEKSGKKYIHVSRSFAYTVIELRMID